MVAQHKVVSHDEWTQARKAFLAREKEFSRQREALARERRDLPWEEVTKDYVFDGPDGKLTLPDLFGGCSQLVVYHFMFPPEWDAGCPHCSFWADSFNGTPVHLRARDVSFAAVSRAPIGKIAAYQQRMGWSFRWVSAGETDFNYDFGVSFTPEEVASHAPGLQLRIRSRLRGPRGDQHLRPGRAGPRVPHVLHLRAGHRRRERHLPVPRSRAQGPRRTRRMASRSSGSAATTSTAPEPHPASSTIPDIGGGS